MYNLCEKGVGLSKSYAFFFVFVFLCFSDVPSSRLALFDKCWMRFIKKWIGFGTMVGE
jgi:hypothetical protein